MPTSSAYKYYIDHNQLIKLVDLSSLLRLCNDVLGCVDFLYKMLNSMVVTSLDRCASPISRMISLIHSTSTTVILALRQNIKLNTVQLLNFKYCYYLTSR